MYVCLCIRLKFIQSSADGSSASIVGDLLDYLNESWTQFHATGTFLFTIFRFFENKMLGRHRSFCGLEIEKVDWLTCIQK